MKLCYSTREVSAMLGLSTGQVRAYAHAGLLGQRGPRHQSAFQFTFRDLAVLRLCNRLFSRGFSHARVTRALRELRRTVPKSEPLSAVRIQSLGDRIVAGSEGRSWDIETGQLELSLDRSRGVTWQTADNRPGGPGSGQPIALLCPGDRNAAKSWFDMALGLEELEPQRAYQAYLQALACDPEHVESLINVGRLCAAAGDPERSAAYARLAIRVDPAQPVAHFNLGVTLHDLNDYEGAISAYRTALVYDPRFADAHYNLATLLQQVGDEQGAEQHMEAYRDACRGPQG